MEKTQLLHRKKVLIINGTAIGEKSGTGITLHNIWDCYPSADKMQLLVTPTKVECDSDIWTIYTPVEFCKVPYKRLVHISKETEGSQKFVNLNRNVKQKSLKAILHDLARGIFDCWPKNYTCLYPKLDEFNPEVIYTCGASIRVLQTAVHIAKRYNCKIILHLMDDWPDTIYTSSLLSKPFHWIVKHELKNTLQQSVCDLAISPALCEKYEKKYQVSFYPLMNPALSIAENVSQRQKQTSTFLYAGSLSLDRWKSLLTVAEKLDGLRRKGYDNKFTLFVPSVSATQETQALFAQYGAKIEQYIPASEIVKQYHKCDVLVFAESFEPEVVDFIKLSLSTKVPEYLAMGKILLAYLPVGIYSEKYIRSNELGFVANDEKELMTCLQTLFSDEKRCYFYAKNALKEAKRNHSKKSALITIDKVIAESTK